MRRNAVADGFFLQHERRESRAVRFGFNEPTALDHAVVVVRRYLGDELRAGYLPDHLLQRRNPGWCWARGKGQENPRFITVVGARRTEAAARNYVACTAQLVQQVLQEAKINIGVRRMNVTTMSRVTDRNGRIGEQVVIATVRIDVVD